MKFGSTWFKAALLGSAMFAAVGFASAADVNVTFNKPAEADGSIKITYGTDNKEVTETEKSVPANSVLAIEVTAKDNKTPVLKVTPQDGTEADVTLTREGTTEKYKGSYTLADKDVTFAITFTPAATGHKLTQDFEADITATYSPNIANMEQVAAGKYTVTFTVPTGRELNEVKLDDTKLEPKEATNPLVFEFTMPNKPATLKATLKPQATKKIKVTRANDPEEGVKKTLFSEAIIEGGELAGWEDDNVEMAQAGVYYIASFAVDIARFDFISLSLKEKNSAGKTAERVVPANRIGVYAPKKKYNCHFTVVTWKSSDDVVECELIVKTKFKDYEITLVDNGATVKIKAEGAEIDPKTTKVTAMSALEFTIEPPQNTSIRKVIFAGAVLKPEADGKTYKATMPEEPAKLIVKIDDGTPVEDNAFADASVYPNPFAEKITVTEVAEANRILLVNAQGVVLRSVAVNGANQIDLDVADVPAGIYMVVVENGAARRAFKVVK